LGLLREMCFISGGARLVVRATRILEASHAVGSRALPVLHKKTVPTGAGTVFCIGSGS
jgi:hypothetical protein